MENKDAGVQKRTYRVMARLIQKGVLKGNEDAVAAIVARINETRKGVAQGAQKVGMIASMSSKAPLTYCRSSGSCRPLDLCDTNIFLFATSLDLLGASRSHPEHQGCERESSERSVRPTCCHGT